MGITVCRVSGLRLVGFVVPPKTPHIVDKGGVLEWSDDVAIGRNEHNRKLIISCLAPASIRADVGATFKGAWGDGA